jgi:hypothetical protein
VTDRIRQREADGTLLERAVQPPPELSVGAACLEPDAPGEGQTLYEAARQALG